MRIGVFGGTFDPPHLGHVAVAKDALRSLDLDRVIFVPAHLSPFKVDESESTGAEIRLQMVQAAIHGEPGLKASRLELDRPPPSYTVDTLDELSSKYPGAELILLLGTDQWASFGRWKSVEEITRLATLAVLKREGTDPGDVDPELPEGVTVSRLPVQVRRIDVSSTEVREQVASGGPVHSLIPAGVHALIEKHALYRAAPERARQGTVSTC